MNGTTDSYVIKRGQTYHYRRRVPADVQPLVGFQWWKFSLKTGKESEAKERARSLATEHDGIIAKARKAPPADAWRKVSRQLDFLDDAVMTARPANFKAAARPRSRAVEAIDKLRQTMLSAAQRQLGSLPQDEQDAIAEAGGIGAFFDDAVAASEVVETERIRLGIRRAVGAASTRASQLEAATLQVRSIQAAKDQATLAKLGLIPDDETSEVADSPRVNSAIEKWFATNKQGENAVKRHRTSLRRFVLMFGNVTVRDITKRMVRDYMAKIENLTDDRRLPTKMRGQLNEVEGLPKVAAPTVERHLISIKAFLSFCEDQEWVTGNVATTLKPPKDTRPKASGRRPFTREERNQLLHHAIEENGPNGDMTWLVKLGAYTGARLEELAQLAKKNVRQLDGVWIVEVDDLEGRNVKTQSKQIPLHPAICGDFVKWVAAGKGDRVFMSFKKTDGRYVNKLSGAFARLMDRAGLTDPRLVQHSFRHTLKREMINARIDPDVRRVILGHAPKDPHDGYAGGSLEAVAAELARLPPLFS